MEIRREMSAAKTDEKRKEILEWLDVTDPSVNHIAARTKHEKDTGEWLLKGVRYQRWIFDPNSVIWLHGKGKRSA
jgi:hypothetical protein